MLQPSNNRVVLLVNEHPVRFLSLMQINVLNISDFYVKLHQDKAGDWVRLFS